MSKEEEESVARGNAEIKVVAEKAGASETGKVTLSPYLRQLQQSFGIEEGYGGRGTGISTGASALLEDMGQTGTSGVETDFGTTCMRAVMKKIQARTKLFLLSVYMQLYVRLVQSCQLLPNVATFFGFSEATVQNALDFCSDRSLEVDLSTLYKRKISNLDVPAYTTLQDYLRDNVSDLENMTDSLKDAFENTLGRLLKGVTGAERKDPDKAYHENTSVKDCLFRM